ncbi:MAG TPA: putative peptidoglycan-binding domain-containing protein [Acidobacteriota bacterium]
MFFDYTIFGYKRGLRYPEKTQTMKKRKTPSRSAEKTKPADRRAKPRKRLVTPAKQKGAPFAAKPEVRRAVPLDYVTTDEVSLRAAPDLAAAKLSGGLLSKGTVVKIAPQDWWYVEVQRPATASGVLRGWVPNALLRRATAIDTGMPAPPPAVAPPPMPTDAAARAALRKKMAESIVKFEGRRDPQGHLRVYILPPGDGGGRYEVAGINDRYHPQQAARLRQLIDAGRFDEAEDYAAEVIADYTDVVAKWTTVPSIEAYLRDCAFNRGPVGAAKILQIALGVKVDGGVGTETLGALRQAEKNPAKLLAALRAAREQYELKVAGRREKFWKGLVNRWDNSLDFARNVA